ncbi:hypothetical protein GCM10017688_04960 [Streptomyces ramulosus]
MAARQAVTIRTTSSARSAGEITRTCNTAVIVPPRCGRGDGNGGRACGARTRAAGGAPGAPGGRPRRAPGPRTPDRSGTSPGPRAPGPVAGGPGPFPTGRQHSFDPWEEGTLR